MEGRSRVLGAIAWLVSVVVQLGCQLCFSGQPLKISAPERYEQKLRHFLVRVGGGVHGLSGLLGIFALPRPESIFTMALIVSNTFEILYCASGSFFCALLVSVLLLFDQATLDLIAGDPGFAVQMLLVTVALLASEVTSFTSVCGVASAAVALCCLALSVLLRFEAWPVAIPIVLLIFANIRADGLVKAICKAFGALVVTGVAVAAAVGILTLFNLPMWERDGMLLLDPLIEVSSKSHNVALFFLVPIAGICLTFSTGSLIWAAGFVVAALTVLYQPLGCVVNDWLVRVVLAKYLLLIGAGSVICSGPAAVVGVPLVGLVVLVAFYFYLHPVQGGEEAYRNPQSVDLFPLKHSPWL
jgi:hypothetical protein